MKLDYLRHLNDNTARFFEVILAAAPDAQVPSCPDWDAEDLLFHLGEVQWFWGRIVRDRIRTGAEAAALGAERPADRAGLEEFFVRASTTLRDSLAASAPEDPLWSWSDDQTAGFTFRRQAHESLIHRLDAELTAGVRTPLDQALAADGVHEALGVMYGEPPTTWGEFTTDPASIIRFETTDTGDSWQVVIGRFAGTDPDSGNEEDVPCLDWAPDDATPTATVSGTAEDLDCWLWHRPPVGTITTAGSTEALNKLAETIKNGMD